MKTRALFEMLEFQQDWEAITDQRPAYYYDFGNLRLTATEVSDPFRQCFNLGGVIEGTRSIKMVNFEMPPEVESFEQGVAWICYGIGEKFQPLRPAPWLVDGRAWKELLPWVRRMRAHESRPQCLVEKDWFRVATKKLRPLAATASESDLVWLSFDGESLRIAACEKTIVLPATGTAWDTRYAIKATKLDHLPKRLTTFVSISIWDAKLSIGNRVWNLAEPDLKESRGIGVKEAETGDCAEPLGKGGTTMSLDEVAKGLQALFGGNNANIKQAGEIDAEDYSKHDEIDWEADVDPNVWDSAQEGAVNAMTIVFEGAGGRYEVHPEQWCEMLIFLEDWGWQPEQLRTCYLAKSVQISDPDSRNLTDSGRRVLEAALADPASVYPVAFDMAKFYELVEFCEAGGFRRSQ